MNKECDCKNDNEIDECIGVLNGLANACCGHNNPEQAYVQFLDGSVVQGNDAVIIQNILKNNSEQTQDRWSIFKELRVKDFEIASKYRGDKSE